MSAELKQPIDPSVVAAHHAPHAWRPHIDTEQEYNPFASIGVAGDGRTQVELSGAEPPAVRDATVDTSPLEGTRDLSDADSLEDVLATAG